MNVRVVRLGERQQLADLHPELVNDRPDLLIPALENSPEKIDDDFPYLFYARDGRRIVGHLMSFPDTLFVDGEPLRWAWNLGLFTEPEYRGQGVAQALVELQLKEFSRRETVRGSVFSSPATLCLFKKLGFSFPGYAPRLCLMRDTRPFLRAHTANRLAVAAGGAAANAILAGRRLMLHRSRKLDRYQVGPIDSTRFSELVQSMPARSEKYSWGSQANWFTVRSGTKDTFYEISRVGESDPCAFLIVRDRRITSRRLAGKYTDFKMMSVMEFGELDRGSDVPESLVSAAVILFQDSDADIAEFVTSSQPIQASALRHGFRALGAGMSFAFKAPLNNPLRGAVTTTQDWHLSHYCGDGFGFE